MLVVESIVILERYYSCCYELGPFTLACLHSQVANSTSFLHFNCPNSMDEYFLKFICDFSIDEYKRKIMDENYTLIE